MGSEEAQQAAQQQILEIQTSGRLGSWEAAEGIAVSAHSAFGTTGQLLTPEQVDIAGVVADFAQRKDISAGATDQLFKVLAAMNIQNAQDARLRIQQLSTVQQASKAKTL